ncbi:MAG: hypothetical protein KDB14_20650 [Planctomycetales bacterium]|nr:hypothetical protein [Planctomycetales bacterium]
MEVRLSTCAVFGALLLSLACVSSAAAQAEAMGRIDCDLQALGKLPGFRGVADGLRHVQPEARALFRAQFGIDLTTTTAASLIIWQPEQVVAVFRLREDVTDLHIAEATEAADNGWVGEEKADRVCWVNSDEAFGFTLLDTRHLAVGDPDIIAEGLGRGGWLRKLDLASSGTQPFRARVNLKQLELECLDHVPAEFLLDRARFAELTLDHRHGELSLQARVTFGEAEEANGALNVVKMMVAMGRGQLSAVEQEFVEMTSDAETLSDAGTSLMMLAGSRTVGKLLESVKADADGNCLSVTCPIQPDACLFVGALLAVQQAGQRAEANFVPVAPLGGIEPELELELPLDPANTSD